MYYSADSVHGMQRKCMANLFLYDEICCNCMSFCVSVWVCGCVCVFVFDLLRFGRFSPFYVLWQPYCYAFESKVGELKFGYCSGW